MSREAFPVSKEDQLFPVKVECPCGCGHEGAPRKKEMSDGRCHVRGCPCPRCRGSRNREQGRKKQNRARRALSVPNPRFAGQTAQEEAWRGPVRFEVKSGRQCGSLPSIYLGAEAQSEAARAIGDVREFGLILMPHGWPQSEGLIVFRLSKLSQVVAALSGQES